jgi:hypothetical protein
VAGYGALPVLLCFTILSVLFLGLEHLMRVVVGKHRETQDIQLPRARSSR